MPKVSRVTIDIDSKEVAWRLRAVRAYYNLRDLADEVDVVISSSHEGLHLIGWFSEVLTDDDQERMRAALCDDPKRLAMDEVRHEMGHPTQVLWTEKSSREGSAIKDYADIHDALDHIEGEAVSDYQRVHGVANYGRKALNSMTGVRRLSTAEGL